MELIAPASIVNDVAAPVARATPGTYWDRNGVLQTAPPNTLRVTYDPADLSAAPYALVEPAATNLMPWSGSLGPGFSNIGPNMAYVGTTDGPGGTAAHKFRSIAPGNSFIIQNPNLAGNTTYTFSYWIRLPSGVKQGGFYARDDANGFAAYGLNVESKAGWQRAFVTFTTGPNSGASSMHLGAVDAIAGYEFDIAMAQLELGSTMTSYILTAGASTARAADIVAAEVGLFASSITESDANDGPLWDAGTTYAANAIVRRPNHRRYRALKGSTGAVPEANTTGATPPWQDVGATARWSVFDTKYSTVAAGAEVVQYVVRAGSVATAAAVLGLDANDARIAVTDIASGVVVYRRTKTLRIKNCRSLTDYLFKPIARRKDEVFDDLPPFKNCLICITVTKPGSTAQISDIAVGRIEYIGEMQWKPEIRTLRRSLIDDDGFGGITFVKRRSSKLITADVSVDTDLADDVVRLLDEYTAEPCVIIGDTRWTSLIILGFVQDFRLVLENEGQDGALYNAVIQGFA